MSWLVVSGAIVFAVVFLFAGISTIFYQSWLVPITQEHFAATIGLPFAALAAFCIVILLEMRSGAVELEAFGFKFRGAAGPAILWVVCFLAIATAIKLLW